MRRRAHRHRVRAWAGAALALALAAAPAQAALSLHLVTRGLRAAPVDATVVLVAWAGFAAIGSSARP